MAGSFHRRPPGLGSVYRGKDREILRKICAATFIVRPDEKKFRFAHTSLQGLAGYLLDALMAGKAESCRLPLPSPETFAFFAGAAGTRRKPTAMTGCRMQGAPWRRCWSRPSRAAAKPLLPLGWHCTAWVCRRCVDPFRSARL